MNNTFDPKNCRYSSEYRANNSSFSNSPRWVTSPKNKDGSWTDSNFKLLEEWAEQQLKAIEHNMEYGKGDFSEIQSEANKVVQKLKGQRGNYTKPEQRKKIDQMIEWFKE